ncbi:MAG: hypothetical protein KDJ77_10085 [Rhodobiaceae bacterium]|nr:hypothetical protein [Rhodobiaceae bacterium]
MITPIATTPDNVAGLRVGGTVIAGDLEAALRKAKADADGKASDLRLVLVIDKDFDGYQAELVHALTDTDVRFRRTAVVAETSVMRSIGAELSPAAGTAFRMFASNHVWQAIDWAAT